MIVAPNIWNIPTPDAKAEKVNQKSFPFEKNNPQAAEIKSKNNKDKFIRSAELTEQEKRQIEELRKRDEAVRRHEQAHIAAGGSLVRGGASYNYQIGPDGKQYAVGGEVQIDISPEDTPEATVRKMQQVQRAALAPADPSAQDRAVAAMAARIEAQAAQEMRSNNKDNDQLTSNNKNSKSKANKIIYDINNSAITPQAKLALAAYRKAQNFLF